MTGPPANFAHLLRARRGYLGTHARDGVAEVMPVCFTWAGEVIWIAVDAKKRSTAQILRQRGTDRESKICFMVDRWDEDWSKLGWLQARGWATILDSGSESDKAMEALSSKYTQYGKRRTQPSIVRLEVEEWRGWEPDANY